MLKKTKNFFNRIESIAFLIATFILFGVFLYFILIYFRNTIIFKNSVLTWIALMIFYLTIFYLLTKVYYKIFKFETKKEILTKSEFKKLLKKKKAYRKKVSKKENRIPKASLAKLKKLSKEGEELNKEFFKGAIFFKSYFVFFLFSFYYGTCRGCPIWSIKNSIKLLPKALKNFFNIPFLEPRYFWNQIKDKEDKIEYYISYLPARGYPKK